MPTHRDTDDDDTIERVVKAVSALAGDSPDVWSVPHLTLVQALRANRELERRGVNAVVLGGPTRITMEGDK